MYKKRHPWRIACRVMIFPASFVVLYQAKAHLVCDVKLARQLNSLRIKQNRALSSLKRKIDY